MLITGCIVAKDEEAHLPDCLRSLSSGAVDSVLVVDHGSRDRTAEVARDFGATVITSSEPHHEQARNAYLEAATTPWLFVIDADERLANPTSLRRAVDGASCDAFAIERYDYFGRGRWASTRLVRLFRRHADVRYFPSRAHTAVAPSIAGRIELGSVAVHHIDGLVARDHEKKRSGMRSRLEHELTRGNPNEILRCFFALELFAMGDEARSTKELHVALSNDARLEPIVRLFLAQQHRAGGRHDLALAEAERCLAIESARFRGRASAYAVLAEAQLQLGNRTAAIATTRAALLEEDIASHQLNLAALLNEPARCDNPWHGTSRIAGEGVRPSIFVQQDALLSMVQSAE